MEIDHYEDAHPPPEGYNPTTTEMEDPYAAAAAHTVYDDEMNLDEMPVTQEDAWAVIRLVLWIFEWGLLLLLFVVSRRSVCGGYICSLIELSHYVYSRC